MKPKSLEVKPCERSHIKSFLEKHHYSHNINGVKSSYCFSVEHEGRLMGAVLFGQMSTTAWKRFGESESEVIELRRLVLLDCCPKNSESRVISQCLRWIKKNAKHIKVVVSYADPNYGHTGVVYKASNFNLAGKSGADKAYKDKDTGKIYHSRALRTKYKGEFKPFVKRLRQRLDEGILEPINLKPKHTYVYYMDRRDAIREAMRGEG